MVVSEEVPQAKVGKFTVTVKPSDANPPQAQQRSDAITAWLLSRWHKQQAERN